MNSGENYRMMTAGGNSKYSRVIQLLNWLAKDKLSILTFHLPFFKRHIRHFKPLILNTMFNYFVTLKNISWTNLLKVLTGKSIVHNFRDALNPWKGNFQSLLLKCPQPEEAHEIWTCSQKSKYWKIEFWDGHSS